MSSAIAQSPILTITGGDGQQHNLPPGTSLTSISSANNINGGQQLQQAPTVKQERHDEAEIAELAAKMLEQQKAALARQVQQQQQQQLSRQMTAALASPNLHGNQANILNYLTRAPKPMNGIATANASGLVTNVASTTNQQNGHQSQNGSSTSTNGKDSEQKPCDEESLKGHFGWTTFGKVFIPFLLRSSEKYCAVRIIEMKLLGKHLSSLHPDIYSSCTYVRSYFITEAESRLLNEINHKHCDGQFGREFFTCKDLVVRLSDATKFYQFLDICYRKLVSGNKSPSDKCGFIRINKESVVPYTVRNGEQVVPLFYFEGETDNLRQKADLLSGWDLAYLKFCCKVQGIRNELFSSESVAVISLTDIKSYFPSGTEFEDYWPSKVVDSNLLLAQKSGNSVNWTRQPVGPPPKVVTPNQIINKQQQQQQHNSLQQQQLAVKRNAIAATAYQAAANMPNNNSLARHAAMSQNNLTAAVQALTNGWNLNSALLSQAQTAQLLQAAQQQQQQQQSRAGYAANRNQTMQNLLNRQNYNYTNGIQQMQQQQQQQPPPLVRSQSQTHMSNYSTTSNQAVALKRSISSSNNNNNNNNSFFPPSSPSLPTPFITPNPSPDQNITNLLLQSQQQFSTNNNNNNNNYLSNSNYSSRNYQNQQILQNSTQKLNTIPSLIPMNNLNKLNASNEFSGSGSSGSSSRNDTNNNIFQQRNLTSDEEAILMNNNIDDLVRKVLLNPAMSTYITKNCYSGQNSSTTVSSPTPVITKLNSSNTSPSLLPSPQSLPPPSPLSYNISPRQYSQSFSNLSQSLIQSQQSNMNFPRQKSVICSPTASTIASTLLSPQSHQRHPELLLPQDQFYNQNLINYNKNNFNYNNASNSSSSSCNSKNILNNNKNNNYQTTKPLNMEVIDLSLSPSRRSPAAALLQQQVQQQAAVVAAAAQQQRYNAMQQRQQVNALAMANSAANAVAMQQHLRNTANMQSQQDQHNLIRTIPEISSGGVQMPPYKMQKVLVFENTMVPCINMKAYNDGDMLMSLVDFRDHFCPNVPLERCKPYIEALGVEMYKGNRRQIQTLLEYGKQHSENTPLILVRDVIKYMPQLRYMMRGNNQEQQPPSKRSRIS